MLVPAPVCLSVTHPTPPNLTPTPQEHIASRIPWPCEQRQPRLYCWLQADQGRPQQHLQRQQLQGTLRSPQLQQELTVLLPH